MPEHGRAQRSTLTNAQMYGKGYGRVQRPTLTNAQMYGEGYMQGKGIWGSFKHWVKKAAKKTNKFLKKTKVISIVGKTLEPLVSAAHPKAGLALKIATKLAKQSGYGVALAGGAHYSGKCKNISPVQHMALKKGYGRWMGSGGVSLVAAKRMYPNIKNISAAQVKALAGYRGRLIKGGGISLAIRGAVKAVKKIVKLVKKEIKGKGYSGMGLKLAGGRSGAGLKLAGMGPYVGAGAVQYKKKRHLRKKPMIIYRLP